MKGLYFHIPFCVQKCRYCDFLSFPNQENMYEPYLKALFREMEQYRGEAADTVFLGGGTPTALSGVQLGRLLEQIHRIFRIPPGAEITTEANPKTVDQEKLNLLRDGGINRISIGVQSFLDEELSMLGRVHTAREAEETVLLAKEWIPNVNLDLMTALPGQTMEKLSATLNRAVKLEPEHLSCYSLIIEEGTPFYTMWEKGLLSLPEEEADREFYAAACCFLAEHGYERYEISNFAKPGFACAHNIKYWQCREYIGLGVGAHSYIGNRRFCNPSDLKEYITGGFVREEEALLTREDAMGEFMIMGLRMTAGVSGGEFIRRFGCTLESVYGTVLEKHIRGGFLKREGKCYTLTDKGIDVSNSVLCDFV